MLASYGLILDSACYLAFKHFFFLMKKYYQSLYDLGDTIKHTNIHGRKGDKGAVCIVTVGCDVKSLQSVGRRRC